ncbi:MAG: dTDP-glucose 4,6-dehydratase [Ignavibacteriaceae bacterium]|jgi:dTDP-glucose 4,6-dehydratase|nr:dTDP-glucose 4,6-dehydratase [Ignavibacteriaceae bacterium]MCW8995187.1 dTDP-glucose 4,6-dehydratase [Psychromonas sp.]MCW8818533.1 dTDP-glucose 4,6-dehydratase [Ignavibacteriaceae bacterium]MCW8960575.1 dTDP-glucose 4,6-dehydratase [Ignavibacteriaceae bacterium]MCW9095215.1 dTDP-glucose 4,6-dehydratase [Ignavibacteriaceae bacterium]
MKKILVTGGAGFIGSNFINYILKTRKDVFIVNLDKLTYAGNLKNLTGVENHPNYTFIKGDIVNDELVRYIFQKYRITHVINFAAESHVDRSILGSEIFFRTNVLGTNILLETAKYFGIEKFVQISTDEVYGSLGPEGQFEETTPLQPNSPYAASKAAADMMALAFHHTYGVPVVITRCSNNYGQYQFPEKLIPLLIINSLNDQKLPVYGDGLYVRDWIYVIDHNKAVELVLDEGKIGEVYNVGANTEKRNIEIVKLVLKQLGKSEELIEFVKDRPGHDRRYAINSKKIKKQLGWEPDYSFENAMRDTINWYIKNEKWWKEIISGEYINYYKLQYQA